MQYIYVVKLDDQIHLTVENTSPQELSDAPVYVASENATPLDGLVRNLVYSCSRRYSLPPPSRYRTTLALLASRGRPPHHSHVWAAPRAL